MTGREAWKANAVREEDSVSTRAARVEREETPGASKTRVCSNAAGRHTRSAEARRHNRSAEARCDSWSAEGSATRSKAASRHHRAGAETRTYARAGNTSAHATTAHLRLSWNEENNSKYREKQHPFHGINPLEKITYHLYFSPAKAAGSQL